MVDSAFGGKSEVRDEAQAKELEWEIEDGSTATANREEKTRGLRSDLTQVWSQNLFFFSDGFLLVKRTSFHICSLV